MTDPRLFITLIEHFGLIIAAAFLLLFIGPFKKLARRDTSSKDKAGLILFFGIFGILGTYGGDSVFDSYANLRAMAVITGGLFGGFPVGIGAGLIAGGHRFLIDIGGFTAVPCGLSTVLEGMVAGYIGSRLKERELKWQVAFLIGLIGESLHMLMVFTMAKPVSDAVALLKVIAFPMIFVNSVGAAFFVEIVRLVFRLREKEASSQAQKILSIANRTVSHLRSGLNEASASATAGIIYDSIDVTAVSITDSMRILGHEGAGKDHHRVGTDIQTQATKDVIRDGLPLFLKSARSIRCENPDCPFTSAAIIPLKKGGEIVGTLKLYGDKKSVLNDVHFQIALGIADLFSTQLELEDIRIKEKLLSRAEIRRLQAQINPHFLFNSLNTIASFCRSSPSKARELILDLSSYMRKNLNGHSDFIRLSEELEQIRSYLAVEKARFGDRIRVITDIEAGCDDWPIPSLIIQPIVENAVGHGISNLEEGGTVRISISRDDETLSVAVEDNGIGMSAEKVRSVLTDKQDDEGRSIGIANTCKRLEQIYGPSCRMKIESSIAVGTKVSFNIPKVSKWSESDIQP